MDSHPFPSEKADQEKAIRRVEKRKHFRTEDVSLYTFLLGVCSFPVSVLLFLLGYSG